MLALFIATLNHSIELIAPLVKVQLHQRNFPNCLQTLFLKRSRSCVLQLNLMVEEIGYCTIRNAFGKKATVTAGGKP